MRAPNYCGQCGKPLMMDENGDRSCQFGHPQLEAGGLFGALRDLVPILRDVRAEMAESLELQRDQGDELRSLRQEVDGLRGAADGSPSDALVDLPEMARLLKVSEDWLRRHAGELGGRQSRKGAPWKFNPAHTLALFGSSKGDRRAPAPTPHQPRRLPSRVALLPVRDEAA
jgi:hypothetical protein